MATRVVAMDYDEEGGAVDKIRLAYGPGGLGILLVRGVPGYAKARERLLGLAQRFATEVPEARRDRYADPASTFQFGWSHGKEYLRDGYTPDYYKGSYYANPTMDVVTDDQQLILKYPTYARPNIWPNQDLPELEPAFKHLGELITNVGYRICKLCDDYVRSANGGLSSRLHELVAGSPCHKARLLHYYPCRKDSLASEDDWCGWHADHCIITGLTGAMFFDESSGLITNNCDPNAGLFVQTDGGPVVHVEIPDDCVAFQIGQAAQVLTGGLLRATLHCVSSPRQQANVSRNSFAVFLQPRWDCKMEPVYYDNSAAHDAGIKQWRPGMNFGDFTNATVNMVYDLNRNSNTRSKGTSKL